MDNFNNGGMDEDKTVLIQQDDMGNPTVQPQGMPQFNQAPQGMPAQPQFGQGMQGMPQQPQFGQGMQGMPQQPQFGQAPQGMPAQPQFGQGMQGMPQQPQFGQAPQGMPMQPQFGQGMQGMPQQPQYGQMPQMNLNNGGNNNPPKKGKGGMIAIISVCAVAVVALIVGLVLILGGKDKDKDKKTTEETTEATTEATTTEETTEATTEETTEETTEATTEATTTEETTEATTQASSAGDYTPVEGLSSVYADLDNRSFAINGKVYTLGVTTLQEMIDDGVPFDEDDIANAGNNINPDYQSSGFKITLGDYYSAQVYVGNYTDENKTMAECPICEIYLPVHQDDPNTILTFAFPLNLTEEDLIANSGEATDFREYVSDDGDYVSHTYEYKVDSERYIGDSGYSFEFANGELRYLYIDLK